MKEGQNNFWCIATEGFLFNAHQDFPLSIAVQDRAKQFQQGGLHHSANAAYTTMATSGGKECVKLGRVVQRQGRGIFGQREGGIDPGRGRIS